MKRITFLIVPFSLLLTMLFASIIQAAPILGGGWTEDEVSAAFVNSLGSPYNYNLPVPAYLTVNDYYISGDNYMVYDGATLILTTAISGVDPYSSVYPFNGPYSWGTVLLSAGAHSLTVQSDVSTQVVPAHFYTRLDPIPEPSTLLLIGVGLASIAGYGISRRKKK